MTESGKDGKHVSFGYFVSLSEPDAKPAINWLWSLDEVDGEWSIDFGPVPLKQWIEQETLRQKRQAEEYQAKLKALEPKLKGLRTILTAAETEFIQGEPPLFRLELVNDGPARLWYDAQQVAVNHSMTITDSTGRSSPYTAASYQTGGAYAPIKPGETVALFDGFDIATQCALSKPGSYKVQFNPRSGDRRKNRSVETRRLADRRSRHHAQEVPLERG